MGAVATAAPIPALPAASASLFEVRGETLEDVILQAWDELVASGRAACPVCAGQLRVTAGCESCACELS